MSTPAQISSLCAAIAQRSRAYADAPIQLAQAMQDLSAVTFRLKTREQREGAAIVLQLIEQHLVPEEVKK